MISKMVKNGMGQWDFLKQTFYRFSKLSLIKKNKKSVFQNPIVPSLEHLHENPFLSIIIILKTESSL
jgi:hypothetical protein